MRIFEGGVPVNNNLVIQGRRAEEGLRIFEGGSEIVAESPYLLFLNSIWTDTVSGNSLTTTLPGTRYDYDGNAYTANLPVISDGGLITGGGYTNLLTWSEAISNAVWGKNGTASVTGTSILNLPADNDSLSQSIGAVVSGVKYTYFFTASGSGTLSTKLDGTNNGTLGAQTITLSATPQIFSKTAVTTANDSSLKLYIRRLAGDTSQVTITKLQVTESPYRLPYVKTEADAVVVPDNNAAATRGSKYTIASSPGLLLALYGTDGTDAKGQLQLDWTPYFDAADLSYGAELVTNGTDWTGATGATPPTGWSILNAGIFTIFDSGDGAPYNTCLKMAVNAVPTANPVIHDSFTTEIGKLYKFSGYFKHGDAEKGQIKIGTAANGSDLGSLVDLVNATWTQHIIYFVATTTTTYITLRVQSSTAGQYELFDQVSIKEVPTVNILTANNTEHSTLFYEGIAQEIQAYDGTNLAVVSAPAVNGVKQSLKLAYDTNTMTLTSGSTVGSAQTFAGSFPYSTVLSLGWESEWQKIENLKIYKEVQ